MMKLYFALWRRDVAERKYRHAKVFGPTRLSRLTKLQKRVERWEYIVKAITP